MLVLDWLNLPCPPVCPFDPLPFADCRVFSEEVLQTAPHKLTNACGGGWQGAHAHVCTHATSPIPHRPIDQLQPPPSDATATDLPPSPPAGPRATVIICILRSMTSATSPTSPFGSSTYGFPHLNTHKSQSKSISSLLPISDVIHL